MRVLVLDAADGSGLAAVVAGGIVLSERRLATAQGIPAALPRLTRDALAEADLAPHCLDLIATVVGPGSFTGIRAALALAHGVALASGVALVGVTVGETLAGRALPLRALWVASASRRDRVFLERDGQVEVAALHALPMPAGPVAVAGTLASAVASRLAALGADVELLPALRASAPEIAAAAVARHQGALPPRATLPLYIDPPEARAASGQRPAPA